MDERYPPERLLAWFVAILAAAGVVIHGCTLLIWLVGNEIRFLIVPGGIYAIAAVLAPVSYIINKSKNIKAFLGFMLLISVLATLCLGVFFWRPVGIERIVSFVVHAVVYIPLAYMLFKED